MRGRDKVLCVVTCGRGKIWDTNPSLGAVEARRAYTGRLARAAVEYAERFCQDYVILSAKHGFLHPWEKVPGPYNVTFTDPSTNPISVEELRRQAGEKGLMEYDTIVVLAGSHYVRVVEEVFKGKRIVTPLKGMDLYTKIAALRRALASNRPLHPT